MSETTLKVRAHAHIDDGARTVSFDAVPWFAQVTDEQIRALEGCDWHGDYPADAVAWLNVIARWGSRSRKSA